MESYAPQNGESLACSQTFSVLWSIASKPPASPLSPPPLRGCPEGRRGKGFPRLAARAPFGRPPASEIPAFFCKY